MFLNTDEATLLGGRVHYLQPATGYRTGIEPVLLAASVPARAGEAVVEAGTGAGAGLLCLAARVAGLACTGVELDPDMAALARRNFVAHGLDAGAIVTGDIADWLPAARYHHAFANPPWHDWASTVSDDAGRERAKRRRPGLLAHWAHKLAGGLHARGTLSFILPARLLAEAVSALEAARCPEITLVPLWPKAGVAAKLLIVRGVRLGAGPCTMHPGLVLHGADGGYTAEAAAILRSAAALA